MLSRFAMFGMSAILPVMGASAPQVAAQQTPAKPPIQLQIIQSHIDAPNPQPAQPRPVPALNSSFQLRGSGVIVIQDLPKPEPPVDLPVVNKGFADDVDIPGSIASILDDLRSDQYAKREAASALLLRLKPERLPDIEKAIAKETDSEAVERLSQIAGHLFLKARTPLSGKIPLLGMRFEREAFQFDRDAQDVTLTIAVRELKPGFPAAQTLHYGDRILSMDGQRFPPDITDVAFQSLVRQHKAGSLLPLGVLRDGKVIEIKVQLAGIDDEVIVLQRDAALQQYLATLKLRDSAKPLIISDSSPTRSPEVSDIRTFVNPPDGIHVELLWVGPGFIQVPAEPPK